MVNYRIKALREEKGMTQMELAQKSNVSRATISGLESGTVKVTTTETLERIAYALGKKVSALFFE